MQKLKKGDTVIVRTGKDKGKKGAILQVITDKTCNQTRFFVEGVNVVKRHTKGNPNKNKPGGIIEKEATIHNSNVSIFNPITKKADKVGIKILEDGRKVRCFRSSGEVIDA